MADKPTPPLTNAEQDYKDAKAARAAKIAYDKASPLGKSIPPMDKSTPPYSTPSGPLSNEQAAEFIRQMQGGRQTKEQEYQEFTRQVPENKKAKGGAIKKMARGGGIESRGKTKGRFV